MFSFLRGSLAEKKSEYFVVDVGGLGFRINSVLPLTASLPEIGEEITVYTYMVVRQDYMGLYGFTDREELTVFEMLLDVKGIGPKLAGALAGSLRPSIFATAVIFADYSVLTSVRGLGKKGAERIVLELKDKVQGAGFDLGGVRADDVSGSDLSLDGEQGKFQEACSALIVLGYSPAQAHQAVTKAYKEEDSVESIIKEALKGMS